MNDIKNNVNFTARLNISDLRCQKQRWSKISQELQKATDAEYPHEIFEMCGDNRGIYVAKSTGRFPVVEFQLEDNEAETFFNKTNKEIVRIFKKCLDLAKFKDNIFKKGMEVVKEYNKLPNSYSVNEHLASNIQNSLAQRLAMDAAKEDSYLKNVDTFHIS